MFTSDKAYYALLTASVFAFAVAAYATLALWGSSWAGFVASAFLLGLFWQQCGWLAHDFCHNQGPAASLSPSLLTVPRHQGEHRGTNNLSVFNPPRHKPGLWIPVLGLPGL